MHVPSKALCLRFGLLGPPFCSSLSMIRQRRDMVPCQLEFLTARLIMTVHVDGNHVYAF